MCHKAEKTAWEATLHAEQTPGDDDTPWTHVTGYDPATGEGVEDGVSCEMCHGRGSVHTKVAADDRNATIVNGVKLATPALQVSICAQCHAKYEEDAPVPYTPGEDLLAKITLIEVVPGEPMQQVNDLVGGKHFENGTVCVTCHTAHTEDSVGHQLRKPVVELCGECHADHVDLVHTKGAAKEGDTCITCHMPDGSHAFAKPVAE